MEIDKKKILLSISNICYLRILIKNDVSEEYVSWINDYEITKYTELKNIKHNMSNVREFVDQKFNSKKDFLFGIYYEGRHIGNIKLGTINWEHLSGDVSYFIGCSQYWRKGIASSVVSKVLNFAIEDLGLEKINSGYYAPNVGSAKVLDRCGFKIEGKILSNVIFEGNRVDSILVGYVKN